MTGFCLKCFIINPTIVLLHYLPYLNLYVARNSWSARSTCTNSSPCGRTVLAPWWCNWRSWTGLEDAVVSQSPQWGCEAGTSRFSLTRLESYWLWYLKIKLINTMIYPRDTGPNSKRFYLYFIQFWYWKKNCYGLIWNELMFCESVNFFI